LMRERRYREEKTVVFIKNQTCHIIFDVEQAGRCRVVGGSTIAHRPAAIKCCLRNALRALPSSSPRCCRCYCRHAEMIAAAVFTPVHTSFQPASTPPRWRSFEADRQPLLIRQQRVGRGGERRAGRRREVRIPTRGGRTSRAKARSVMVNVLWRGRMCMQW